MKTEEELEEMALNLVKEYYSIQTHPYKEHLQLVATGIEEKIKFLMWVLEGLDTQITIRPEYKCASIYFYVNGKIDSARERFYDFGKINEYIR